MLEQRDIVLVPVPYTELSKAKRRPALVLSSTAWNKNSQDFLVISITSNLASSANGIVINTGDMERSAIPKESLARPDKIYTLLQSSVLKNFGKLNEAKFEEVLQQLDAVIGR